MSDYHDQARVMLKELRLCGWTRGTHSFNLTKTATLEIGYRQGSQEGKYEIPVWWVSEEGRCSTSKDSPKEAIAQWLREKDDP